MRFAPGLLCGRNDLYGWIEMPLMLVEESLTMMHNRISVELILERWKDMNLFDVMMTELLKGRD